MATSTPDKPAPAPKTNRIGLAVLDYKGGRTTLCAGCGHNAISERIIEEERNIIRSLEVVDVTHRFGNNEVGLEGVSFSVNRGELVCGMGASGVIIPSASRH